MKKRLGLQKEVLTKKFYRQWAKHPLILLLPYKKNFPIGYIPNTNLLQLPGIWPCSSPYRVDNIYTGNKNSTNAYCQQFLRSQLRFFQQIGHRDDSPSPENSYDEEIAYTGYKTKSRQGKSCYESSYLSYFPSYRARPTTGCSSVERRRAVADVIKCQGRQIDYAPQRTDFLFLFHFFC